MTHRYWKTAGFMLLAVGCASQARSTQVPKTGVEVIRAMHDRYGSTWYSTVSFTEVADQRTAEGVSKSETWYEEAKLPGRLRIDVGVPATDRKSARRTVLYVNDIRYIKDPGQPLGRDRQLNILLVLGFDVYKQPVERSVAELTAQGFDMSRVHQDVWRGRRVYVVGAEKGDKTSKQFWVDADRLVFVRLLDPAGGTEALFDDYRPVAGGWIAAEVTLSSKGVVRLHELYSNIEANVTVPDTWFDPKQLQ